MVEPTITIVLAVLALVGLLLKGDTFKYLFVAAIIGGLIFFSKLGSGTSSLLLIFGVMFLMIWFMFKK